MYRLLFHVSFMYYLLHVLFIACMYHYISFIICIFAFSYKNKLNIKIKNDENNN